MRILAVSASVRYVGDRRRARDWVRNAVERTTVVDEHELTWILM